MNDKIMETIGQVFTTIGGIFEDYFEYKRRLAELRVEEHRIDAQYKLLSETLRVQFQENLRKLSFIEKQLSSINTSYKFTFEGRTKTKNQLLKNIQQIVDKLVESDNSLETIKIYQNLILSLSSKVLTIEINNGNDFKALISNSIRLVEHQLPKLLPTSNSKLIEGN